MKLGNIDKIFELTSEGVDKMKTMTMNKRRSFMIIGSLVGGVAPVTANAGLLNDLKRFGNATIEYTQETANEISETDTYKDTKKGVKKRGKEIKNSERGKVVVKRGEDSWSFVKGLGNKLVEYDENYKKEQARKNKTKEYSQTNENQLSY